MRQPTALIFLFLTEMWERFGFYIVEGLLIFYMTRHLSFTDPLAYAILGEFTALAYISPIIGGYIADRVLGFRYSILIGAILLCIGYAIIATLQHELLFVGLATVIMGNGFLKPNISSYLGEFYLQNDSRREAGYTIFYVGINIGVMLSTLTSGFIQQYFGWAAIFGVGSFGMLIAISSYLLGIRYFERKGLPPARDQIKNRFNLLLTRYWTLISLIVVGIIIAYLLLRLSNIGNELLLLAGLITLIALLVMAKAYQGTTRNKMIALIVLIFISIIFWGLFFQMFFTVNLFIDRAVDRHLFGIMIPPVVFISLESIFIILLGPLFANIWHRLARHQKNPSLGVKFALAMLMLAIAMIFLIIAIKAPLASGLVNPLWIVLVYCLITIGELFLSPIGLSMITTLAPPKRVGLMMGVWFMALGFGGSLAGVLAQQASVPKGVKALTQIKMIYAHAFWHYALLALIMAVVVFLLSPWLKKLVTSS